MKRNLLAILFCVGAMTTLNTQSSAQSRLLYYWNFNSWTPLYTAATPVSGTVGGVYASIPADYAAPGLSTSNANWVDRAMPGVSPSYSTYCDNTATGDTTNARLGAIPGVGFKARNPNDSMEILIYMPTTHYANFLLKYACELSSYTSGDSINVFSYSLDSGTSFITSGAGLSEWVDSGSLAYKLVSVRINDPLAVNNSKLVFRINLVGRITGTSGNNRFDNVTLEGDSITSTLNVNQFAANEPAYTLFPNPATNQVTINANVDGNKSVTITNVVGQEVFTANESGNSFSVNTANLNAGVYYVAIRENATGNLTTLKFVKQ